VGCISCPWPRDAQFATDTFETLDGVKSRTDWVVKDLRIVEGKTNGATLSKGQSALEAAIKKGEPVIPRGENARAAGLEPGKPVKMKDYQVERCSIDPRKGKSGGQMGPGNC